MDVEAGQDILESTLETLNVSIELVDVILQAFDPALLLGNMLATFLLAVVNEFCKVVSQPFILHVPGFGKGRMDDANDGWGEGSCMYRWLCGLMRYGRRVEKVGSPMDKVRLS